jgi:hypothetical protein
VPDPGVRTPLLDFFRRGEVARDIRLQAAQGGMAPRAHEQIALLMLLVDDHDPEIKAAADATLDMLPRPSLEAFLARADASKEMREFFADRGVLPGVVPAQDEEADSPLLDTAGDFPHDEIPEDAPEDDERRASIVQKIASLNVAGRMSLAMKGSREERAVLIRDPNKIVAAAVLSSPKMNEAEVEAIAKMANVTEDVLRSIAMNRAWTKNYAVVYALVKNPKMPVALSMNFLQRINDRDLKTLSTSRNIPEALRIAARKKVVIDK